MKYLKVMENLHNLTIIYTYKDTISIPKINFINPYLNLNYMYLMLEKIYSAGLLSALYICINITLTY